MYKTILSALALSALPAPAAVVISEVLFNEIGSDTSGEWIEIYNTGSVIVDLGNWHIGDEETSGAASNSEGMFTFPTGSAIGPGEIQVIAVNADVFHTNYGFYPKYEVGTGVTDNVSVPNLTVYAAWDPDTAAANTINMANANDQVLLLDSSDALVDAVNWGNTFSLNPGLDPDAEADGQSWYRLNGGTDTDTAADWALSPGGAGSSSPGVVPEPGSSVLLALLGGCALLRRRREA